VNGASQGLFGLNLINGGKFLIDLSETWPILSFVNVNKCRKVERGVKTDVLTSSFFSSVKEEVSNSLINSSDIFEFCNKWANILKGRASYNLGGRILQKLKVQFLHISRLLLQWAHLGYFSHNVSTCLAHLLFFVQSQFLVKRKDLLAEAIYRNIFAHI
jgi:hypothetical protein